jgi:membrane protein
LNVSADPSSTSDPSPDDPRRQPAGDRRRISGRVASTARRTSARADELRRKAEARLAAEEPSSRTGVAVEWFARFRRSEGQLNSILLAAFLFLTLVPAMVVIATYVSADPRVVATRMIARLDLTGATAELVRDVLTGAGGEKLVATLIAVVSVVLFGLGIGRTLQIVYARIWGIDEPKVGVTENVRYFAWLAMLIAGGSIYVIELAVLKQTDSATEWVFAPFWIFALVAFFAWTPVFLLHRQITWREAVPGAVVATIGLLGVRLLSSVVFTNWLNWYGKYYGGIGIAIALFFWLALITSVLIVGAAFAPAYAVRRKAKAGPQALGGGGDAGG